jgi:integrase
MPTENHFQFNQRSISALLTTGEKYFVWDTRLPRFGLYVTAEGTKTFVITYRNAEGKSRLPKVCRFIPNTPGVVNFARERASKWLLEVEAGGDPAQERKDERQAITVDELIAEYTEKGLKGLLKKRGKRKKDKTINGDAASFKNHISPLLGSRKVRSLTERDIRIWVEKVITGETAGNGQKRDGDKRGRKATGGEGAARRTLAAFSGAMKYAISMGYLEKNPCAGPLSDLGSNGAKERRFTPDEYAAIGRALREAEDMGQEPWQELYTVRFLLITGLRLEECGSLSWPEVKFEDGMLVFKEDKTTGRTIKSGIVRPLSPTASKLLKSTLELGDGDRHYVFPGLRDPAKSYGGTDLAWGRIMKAAGVEGSTPHTARHSFASLIDDFGYSKKTNRGILGHKGNEDTNDKYIHKNLSDLIKYSDAVANAIERTMLGDIGVIEGLSIA